MAASQSGRPALSPTGMQRNFSYELLKKSLEDEEIVHPLQGVSKMAKALVGSLGVYYANKGQKEEEEKQKQTMAEVMAMPEGPEKEAKAATLGPDFAKIAWSASARRQEAAAETARAEAEQERLLQEMRIMRGGGGPPSVGGIPPGGGMAPPIAPQVEPAPEPMPEPPPQTPPQTQGLEGVISQKISALAAANPTGSFASLINQWDPANGQAHVKKLVDAGFDPTTPLQQHAQNLEGAIPLIQALPRGFVASLMRVNPGQPAPGASQGPPQGQGAAMPPPGAGMPPDPSMPTGAIPGASPNVIPAQAPMQPRGQPQPARDPGAEWQARADRAEKAGRPDLVLKYEDLATKDRQAAANRPQHPERVKPVDMGDSMHLIDQTTGETMRVIPKGSKPGDPKGTFGTTPAGIAWEMWTRGEKDPAFKKTPEYRAALEILSDPTLNEGRGAFIPKPPPGTRAGSQPGQPPAPTAAPGMPYVQGSLDYPSAAGPQAAPPGAAPRPPGSAIPIPGGLPPKEPPEAFNKLNTEIRTAGAAVNNYQKILTEQGGGSWKAFMNDPRSPAAQRLNGAYETMKMTLRSEAFINTGVLQPAEAKMLDDMLLSPQTARGLYATPEAYAAKLDEIRKIIDFKLDAAHKSHSLPPPPPTERFYQPKDETRTYSGPDGSSIRWDEIQATAKNRGITPDEVVKRLGLKPR